MRDLADPASFTTTVIPAKAGTHAELATMHSQ
jgi:hypothetical protein